MPSGTDPRKETLLKSLTARAIQNKDTAHIDNTALNAGEDMYYYCRICNQEMRYPEVHTEPRPNHCPDCETLLRSNPAEQFVVEVHRHRVDTDPSINVFKVRVQHNDGGTWQETCATNKLLQNYLNGLVVVLSMSGFWVAGMAWSIPDSWSSPSGKRWTIRRGVLILDENLDDNGAALTRP